MNEKKMKGLKRMGRVIEMEKKLRKKNLLQNDQTTYSEEFFLLFFFTEQLFRFLFFVFNSYV